jgi:hypothetical protein
MINSPEKRFFLKTILQSASRTFGVIADITEEKDHGVKEIALDISSDLPPELMAMEAQRLGLDPLKDRKRILQSIQDAMRKPNT